MITKSWSVSLRGTFSEKHKRDSNMGQQKCKVTDLNCMLSRLLFPFQSYFFPSQTNPLSVSKVGNYRHKIFSVIPAGPGLLLPGIPRMSPHFTVSHSHLICDCCMSSFSSPLLKTHSNSSPWSPGLASTPQVTLTRSPLAAPNTSLVWAAHTGASADRENAWNWSLDGTQVLLGSKGAHFRH